MAKEVTNDAPKKDSKESTNTPKVQSKTLLTVGLVILLVFAIGTSVYFYRQYKNVKNDPASAVRQKNSKETDQVLTEVKKILLIDTTEPPTVARVEDSEALKTNNAVFYRNVEKGDYLVLYKDRAIIYRESNNQIINVAPIINTAELQQKQQEQSKSTKKTN